MLVCRVGLFRKVEEEKVRVECVVVVVGFWFFLLEKGEISLSSCWFKVKEVLDMKVLMWFIVYVLSCDWFVICNIGVLLGFYYRNEYEECGYGFLFWEFYEFVEFLC